LCFKKYYLEYLDNVLHNQGVITMYYRLFILDRDENLVTGVDYQSPRDDEALDWASFVLAPGRIGELWCGTRRVGRAAPLDDGPPGTELRFIGREPAADAAQAACPFG
jgi:hypothetical protein